LTIIQSSHPSTKPFALVFHSRNFYLNVSLFVAVALRREKWEADNKMGFILRTSQVRFCNKISARESSLQASYRTEYHKSLFPAISQV